MKAIFRMGLIMLCAFFTVGCAVTYDNVGVKDNGKAYAKELTESQKDSIEGLKQAIMKLGLRVDRREAGEVAYNAVVYPMHLSNEYELIWPPSLQNIFVNSGKRERGLCYQWAEDMLTFMRSKNYKTLGFDWVISERGLPEEHNSAIVVAKGHPWQSGIILDPWRNSGNLFWDKVKEDTEYKWVLYVPKNRQIVRNFGMEK